MHTASPSLGPTPDDLSRGYSFGSLLRRARELAGLTVAQLAERIGWSTVCVAEAENADGKPAKKSEAINLTGAVLAGLDRSDPAVRAIECELCRLAGISLNLGLSAWAIETLSADGASELAPAGPTFARLMRERNLQPAELASKAGVSIATVDLVRGQPGGRLPGRFGICSIVRAIHLRAPIGAEDLAVISAATGIPAEQLVGGDAGSQRLERSLGVRRDEPVYADLSLREVGRVLRQLRLDRALTESMVASPCLVLSETVVQAVEHGAVSKSPWLSEVLVVAMLRSMHRVRPVDASDARFLDGLLGLPAGRLESFLSRDRAEGGAA